MSLSKFEKKKQKLLQKNARLQGKKNQFATNVADESKPASIEWNEMIRLLSTKDIVLRPQELFEYFALLIQSFAGLNVTVALNRNASSLSNVDNATKHNVSNIACIIPIINDVRWKSSNYNPKYTKYSIIDKNISAFGILTDRKTLMRKSVESYQVTPYFLTKQYEWRCITDTNGIYFSTLCKDYRVSGVFKEKIVDNSYRNTANIQDGIIICTNKYGYIPIYCTQNDIFYTDPRMQYKDIKKRWNDNIPKDDIVKGYADETGYTYYRKKKVQKVTRNNPRLKKKKKKKKKKTETKESEEINDINDTNDTKINETDAMTMESMESLDDNEIKLDENENDTFNVSLSIMDDAFSDGNVIIRLWTQSDGKIYALRDDGILYNIIWKEDNNNNDEKKEETNESYDTNDIKKIMRNLDSKQPNYTISGRKGAFSTEYTVKVWKYDPNIKNMNKSFERKCNKLLKRCQLFEAVECDKFDMSKYNQRVHRLNRTYDTMHSTLIYGAYYDNMENGSGLYIAQNTFDRANNIHSWDLGFIFNEKINEKLVSEYEKLYTEFMEKHKYLKEEECYIMFVDERNVKQKQIIIICGKYLVQINMLNEQVINRQLFGNVFSLNEIIPELCLGINVRGAKWYYSYIKQTLYIFERLSVSSNYPYRLRQITLSSFQFQFAK